MNQPALRNFKLAYAITLHPDLGYRIEAFAVALTDDKSFSISSTKVTTVNINETSYDVTPLDREIIGIIDQYSEESIVKKYAVKTRKFADFIKKECDTEKLEKVILPYINRRKNAIFQLFDSNDMTLYYKGKKQDYIHDNEIKLQKNTVEVVFNVDRSHKGLKYYLSIRDNERFINLFNEKPVFLSNEPVRLLIGNSIYAFDEDFDRKKLQPFLSNEFIIVPKEIETKFFQTFLLKTLRKYDVKATGFKVDKITSDFKPVLKLHDNWQFRTGLVLEFHYPEKVFLANDPDLCSVKMISKEDDITFVKKTRNSDREKEIIELLKSKGLVIATGAVFITPEMITNKVNSLEDNLYILINWLNDHKYFLEAEGIIPDQDFNKKKFFTGEISIDYKERKKIDWFDIFAIVRFGTYQIPLSHLRKHIVFGNREFQLPDGSFAILPEHWFLEYKNTLLFAREKDGYLQLDKELYKLFKQIPAENVKVDKEKALEFSSLKGFTATKVSEHFSGILRPYQLSGFNWLYYFSLGEFGCCLADDMGLGKTIQTLALLLKCHDDNAHNGLPGKEKNLGTQLDLFSPPVVVEKSHTSLLLMPTSLIYNWLNEIDKFAPSLKVYIHAGGKRARSNLNFRFYDVILTSYGLIRNDIDLFRGIEFNYIVLDESQVIKNPESKIFESVIQLKSAHKLILTGTPIENSITDLWTQFEFINPGLLGSLNYFKKEYVTPIEKNDHEIRSTQLKELIKPFILRRTKKEVEKDLPPLTETISYCKMTEEQAIYYELKKAEIRNYIFREIESNGIQKKMFIVLKGLMQLRLICNHPVLTDADYKYDSGKFKDVVHQIENLIAENHKVLVYSTFVIHLNLFDHHLKNAGIPFEILTGKTPAGERMNIVNRFQSDENKRIFLISIKAGGFGFNLTAADYVFILDPWWNPAVETQAIHRAHRIGQDKKVFAYKFITKDTVEEKILRLQNKKKLLAEAFITTNNPLRDLNLDEIMDLFD